MAGDPNTVECELSGELLTSDTLVMLVVTPRGVTIYGPLDDAVYLSSEIPAPIHRKYLPPFFIQGSDRQRAINDLAEQVRHRRGKPIVPATRATVRRRVTPPPIRKREPSRRRRGRNRKLVRVVVQIAFAIAMGIACVSGVLARRANRSKGGS